MSILKKIYQKTVSVRLPIIVILIFCSIFVVYFLIHVLANNLEFVKKDQKSFYWLFSAASQSIATFFAFLIAGYTLFVTMIDGLKANDDSLADIIDEEKRSIFMKIKILSIVVGLSLLLNLLLIFCNGRDFEIKTELILITIILTVIAIIFGIWIVITMINPRKDKIVAAKLIYKDDSFNQSGSKQNEQEFFSNFKDLEKNLRDYIKKNKLYIPSKQPQFPSFREIINELYYAKLIDGNIFEELIEVNKYRNLLFHGEANEASESMVGKVISLNSNVQNNLKIKK